MKKIFAIGVVLGGLTSAFSADCANTPVDMELAKTIEEKDVAKAKTLLKAFKADVQKYLDNCDKSKEKFEETSVMILTYEDRLADVEADLKNASGAKVDCSKVPSGKAMETAGNEDAAKKLYVSYKKDAQDYIDNCASHVEYELVFEESLLYEEEYGQ